jgi:hypothetical protein
MMLNSKIGSAAISHLYLHAKGYRRSCRLVVVDMKVVNRMRSDDDGVVGRDHVEDRWDGDMSILVLGLRPSMSRIG